LVVQLVSRIKSKLGVGIPIGKIFELPTVERLADHIDAMRRSSADFEGEAEEAVRSPWYSVVPIHHLGSRLPLFGIHSTRYRTLGHYLGAEQPLYTLRYGLARATDGTPTLPDRIEELATHYVEEMRTVQPEGPYLMMGLCIGGLIAFEMAHQLIDQGEKVALLALFDPLAPGGQSALPLRRRVHNLFRVGAVEVLKRAKKKVGRRGQRLTTSRRDDIAQEKYQDHRPQRTYPGSMSIFKPAHRVSLSYSFADDLGWGKLVTGVLEVHEVPGDHTNMFEEPHVRVVAEKLGACIDKANALVNAR
jgi:aspartate racemase